MLGGEGGTSAGTTDLLIFLPTFETPIVNHSVPLRFDEVVAKLVTFQLLSVFCQQLRQLVPFQDFELSPAEPAAQTRAANSETVSWKIPVAASYRLADAARALAQATGGHVGGAIVLIP